MNDLKNTITQKKYQHYVPQFYLKLFSNDKKSIGLYLLDSKKYISNASIREIGGDDYFYGKDGELEDWFGELESKWSIIIKKIIENNELKLDITDYIYLLMFIYLSDARNKNNANIMNKFVNELAVTAINMYKENDIKISYKDKIVSLNSPNIYSIIAMEDIIPILLDLKLSLIINNTNNQFITSDCIVTRYNQFLLERGYKRGYAYGTCGIECFVPISPKYCLCLYDDTIYETKKRSDIIIVNSCDEINKINKLFLYNSDKNIFFNNTMNKNRVDTLMRNYKKLEIDEDTIFKSNDGEMILKIGSRCIDKNFSLQILSTRKNAKKIKVDLNVSAPIRPYVSMLTQDNEDIPEEIKSIIEGKKFYLTNKE